MRNSFFIFLLSITVISCDFSSENEIDISAIDVELSISRFDIDFYSTTESSLQQTKSNYPMFFPPGVPDSIWIEKLNSKDERGLFNETQKVFPTLDEVEADLVSLFKHVTYYYSDFIIPEVITLLSNIDYDNKIIYTKDTLLISLDVYLGSSHPFYSNFPAYIKQNYHRNHIVVDVANSIIETKVAISNNRSFISKMISEGKKLYLLDKFLYQVSDEEKIGYQRVKLDWAIANESQIWKYFIENKLLYSTDTMLNKRFLDDSPFSKFYRSEDNLSPGRIGTWFGWQIVRSFMKHNDVSLHELMKMNSEEIFKKSKYKPKK